MSSAIEELQYGLGEGPSIEAFTQDRGVIEPDLAELSVHRWPAFSGPAVEAGVRAVFAFPIRIGAVRLGALSLHRDRPGPLTADQHTDSLMTAEVTAEAILALQADAEAGQIARALEVDGDFHYVVHQASGMIAAQLDRCVEIFAVDAAGLMVVAADGSLRGMAASSDATRTLELFELRSREGPCFDCFTAVNRAGFSNRPRRADAVA